MQAITHWITQIILIIMFAMILELLLPNDSFNRYVKMVIGLVLIVALLSPIMQVFHTPVETIFSEFSGLSNNDPIKNSINEKKREIESEQRAYISKQMAVQMKSSVKGELRDRYGLIIQTLDLKLNPNQPNSPIEHVSVTLGQAQTTTPSSGSQSKAIHVTVDPVEPVTVNVNNDQSSNGSSSEQLTKQEKAVQSFLSNTWNISADQLTVRLKGGGNE
ncbi:MAG TPA: stage III sporulation protein AF [Sporolactobacillaceae bacterium]|nr:stage III sporulation protein AF [Sporolactobacillaceae bacterium]